MVRKQSFKLLITLPTRISTKNSLIDHIYTNENNTKAGRTSLMPKSDKGIIGEKGIAKKLSNGLDHYPVLCRIDQQKTN